MFLNDEKCDLTIKVNLNAERVLYITKTKLGVVCGGRRVVGGKKFFYIMRFNVDRIFQHKNTNIFVSNTIKVFLHDSNTLWIIHAIDRNIICIIIEPSLVF